MNESEVNMCGSNCESLHGKRRTIAMSSYHIVDNFSIQTLTKTMIQHGYNGEPKKKNHRKGISDSVTNFSLDK